MSWATKRGWWAEPTLRITNGTFGRSGLVALILIALLSADAASAEDKKDDKKKEAPKILCVSPFAIIPGTTSNLRIRGQSLADATGIKVAAASGDPLAGTIKSKGKSEPPKPFEAARAGDTELQVELKFPATAKPGEFSIVVITPNGETPPVSLRVVDPAVTVNEKEPNGGFKTAQELPLDKTVLGIIQETSDVDVFRIGGRAGMKIIAEVKAERSGSLLDGALTLYDAAGHVLATADDSDGSRDPILRATLGSDGVYYLSLTDANDRGSSSHAYELTVREDK